MDEKSRAVLATADAWLTAIQALTAAYEEPRRSGSEQEAFDTAEVALAAAVMAWREDRRS